MCTMGDVKVAYDEDKDHAGCLERPGRSLGKPTTQVEAPGKLVCRVQSEDTISVYMWVYVHLRESSISKIRIKG